MRKCKPVLQVFEVVLILIQSGDTGDHLDGGWMLPFGSEETGLNLAGDNSGRSRCDVRLSASVCWTAVASTDRLGHSEDMPNGPTVTQDLWSVLYRTYTLNCCLIQLAFWSQQRLGQIPQNSITGNNWKQWMVSYLTDLQFIHER